MTLPALFRTASLVLGTALLAACASNPTKLAETWVAPGVTKIDAQRIVVVAYAPSEATRTRMETEFTSRMKRSATPSNLVLSGDELKDPAKAVAKIKAAGYDTAVVMRLVDQQTYVLAVPNQMQQHMSTSPYYQQSNSTYATNFVVETVVFSVIEGKPLVRITTETFQTPDLAVLADRVIKTIVGELNARGLL